MTNERPLLTRRHLLRTGLAATTALLAGCSAGPPTGQTPSLAVEVKNRFPESQPVTILVVSGDGETVEAVEYDVRPDASRTHRVEDLSSGSYRIIVDGPRWKTTTDWDTATCSEFRATTTISEAGAGTPHTALSSECLDE